MYSSRILIKSTLAPFLMVFVISTKILIKDTILITNHTYKELWRGGLVNGTNTYNETPVYYTFHN